MDSNTKSFARNMFKLLIYEANGQIFENLFSKILGYAYSDFQQVKPHGIYGDKKNDGWIKSENTYFQVYAPETLSDNILTAINKVNDDFNGLKEYWNDFTAIKKFYFVVNDKFLGCSPLLNLELEKIQKTHSLLDAKVFTSKNLEEILFNLADDKIISIIGHIPNLNNEEFMFISGFTCFITAWIEFEKKGKEFLLNNGFITSRQIAGNQIIDGLKKVNKLDNKQVDFLLKLSKERNKLIHGDTMEIPKMETINNLMKITEQI